MPSPTDVVNAIEPDLSPTTTTLGCLSTTALGCVSSVAGASSTAGAAATAAGARAAGTSSSGGPSSGAAESALVAAALSSTARSAAAGGGGTGPDAHASCASNCFTCSQTCAVAQCARGAYRPGVPGGRWRASRTQGRAAACALLIGKGFEGCGYLLGGAVWAAGAIVV